jgi:anaerobic magnesium-protoporphyrin IX monomethyl ester cyclase
MDLLLTHGYFLHEDPKELQIMKPYVPLGILYISSHLRAKGYAVEVFDTTFSTRSELFALLRSSPPAVLGVYSNLMTRPNVLEVLRVAKETGWQTVVGGPEPGAYIHEYLEAGSDVVVIGEGEITMQELLPALQGKPAGSTALIRALTAVKGIAFRGEDGAVHQTASRPHISDIDSQPWPDRERVDIELYVRTWREHHGMGSVSLITARGCPYHCRWCSHEVFGKTHRRRKPGSVVDELEWLLNRYHPDMAWLADDVFTIHHGWLYQYAAEMKRRGLQIPFECITRADRLNAQVMDTLAELGCLRIWIGSESGSQRILDAMERGVTAEQVRSAVALAKSRAIKTGMFLMWGYEGEELEDIEATVEHVKRSNPDVFFTTVSYPIKGTPYFGDVSGRLVSLKSWTEASDRDYRIRGRHSRRFYQYADQLLRSEVELDRLLKGGAKDSGDGANSAPIGELEKKVFEARQGLRASFTESEA